MELLQLKYFVESAEAENFSMVAKKHFIPTSAVSSSIKKLENELGCTLFDRTANRIKLNKNGEKFLNSVSAALNLIEMGKDSISPKNNTEPQKIQMLIRTERSLISEKILQFCKKHRNVSFYLTHNYSTVDTDKYDIIIDELSNTYHGYTKKSIVREKIKIASSVNNPLANKKFLFSDLKLSPFISMSNGSSLNRITNEVCHRFGFNPNIVIESDDPFYIRKYIKEDFGITFYPEKSWKNDSDDGICFLNIIDYDYSRTTYAYLNNNKNVTKSARDFFDFIAEDNG